MDSRLVSLPKSFFESERDRFYGDWTLAFWRELFQNSVDAGASSIDIEVTSTAARGSFDRPAPVTPDTITRIVFSDDGCGMAKDTLEEVYFSMGASTKGDGDSIGGYGRARLMTCFANVRYSILTLDQFVLGDGPHWLRYGLDDASRKLDEAIMRLLADPLDGGAMRTGNAVEGLEGDRRMIVDAMSRGGHRGCRIEVDLDPTRGQYYRRPTVERMLAQLRTYLSESQIVPRITVNGEVPEVAFGTGGNRIQARRGPVRRTLSASLEGVPTPFANVHLSEGAKAAHKGKVIVRVDGASMFVNEVEADIQVIVELDRRLSREVMTSNRDGLRGEFRDAFQSLLQEIAVDNQSALRDKSQEEHILIEGDKGHNRATAPRFETFAREEITSAEMATGGSSRAATPLEAEPNLYDFGLPIEGIEAFLSSLRRGNSLVSGLLHYGSDFRFRNQFLDLRDAVQDSGETPDPKLFFSKLSPDARAWISELLRDRYLKHAAHTRDAPQLADFNDIVIHVDRATPAIRAAIRRNDPRAWDVATGKGRQPRALLVAWTEACAVAVETLFKIRPSTSDFEWTTGWCYDVPKETDQGDRTRELSIRALFVRKDGRCAFLVNPVTHDGRLAFNPSDAAHRQSLQAKAMHEVAHVLAGWHNEAYVGTLTDLMSHYDFKVAHRRMKDAVKGVYAAYERGRAMVQAMDDEPGPRPAERLLALAVPGDVPPSRLEDLRSVDGDNVEIVDCDAIDYVDQRKPDEPEPAMAFGR